MCPGFLIVWISKVMLYCNCVYMLTGQDEMEDIACTTDELDENDSLALYFCSPKITANGKQIFLCIYILEFVLKNTPKGLNTFEFAIKEKFCGPL